MATTFSSTVLVVDDDDDVRALAVSILHDAGYRAIPAASGDVAINLLLGGLYVDVLFTDIVMPGELDGFALAFEAKQIYPDMKVLYTTGFSGFSASTAPIYGKILDKPYRPSTLASEVMRLLGDSDGYEERPSVRI
jgi:DNA-binding NtrC family response regulator